MWNILYYYLFNNSWFSILLSNWKKDDNKIFFFGLCWWNKFMGKFFNIDYRLCKIFIDVVDKI